MLKFSIILLAVSIAYVNLNLIQAIEINSSKNCKEFLDDNMEYILCTGINLTNYDEIEVIGYRKNYHSDVRFENCSIPILPKNFFKYFIFVGYLKIHNCKLKKFHQVAFEGSHLYTLSLRQNEITVIQPEIFQSMNFLKLLDLSQNQIQKLQNATFSGMQNLEKLFLKDNLLQHIEISYFDELKQLVALDLSDNQIESIDEKAFNKNARLKSLVLSNNKLKMFNDVYYGLKINMEYLDLSQNHLQSVKFSIITDLKYLNLSRTQILNGFDYDTFIKTPVLHVLDLSYNKFGKIDIHIFYPLRALRKLFLQGNNFTELDYEDAKFDPVDIDITDNDWNCTYLAKLIKHINSQSINLHLFPWHKPTKKRNIAGVGCYDMKSIQNKGTTGTDDYIERRYEALNGGYGYNSIDIGHSTIDLLTRMNSILIFLLIIVLIFTVFTSVWKVMLYKRYYYNCHDTSGIIGNSRQARKQLSSTVVHLRRDQDDSPLIEMSRPNSVIEI